MFTALPDKPRDPLRQKSRRWAVLAGIALLPGAFCLLFIARLWQLMAPLGAPAFLLAAAALAFCLIVLPLLSLAGWGLALFFRFKAGRRAGDVQ